MLANYKGRATAFDINDEDIQQTLPGTLEAFETGVNSITTFQTTEF